jgi:hypothetical protein
LSVLNLSATRVWFKVHRFLSRLLLGLWSKEVSEIQCLTKSPSRGLHEQACIIVNNFSDTQTDKAPGNPRAAICVQKISARRVLQFTPLNAASCVLHRPTCRVIHRLQLFCLTASILTSQSRFGLRLPLAQKEQKDFQLSRRPVFQGSSSLATGTSLVSEDRQGQVARYPPHARHHTRR